MTCDPEKIPLVAGGQGRSDLEAEADAEGFLAFCLIALVAVLAIGAVAWCVPGGAP